MFASILAPGFAGTSDYRIEHGLGPRVVGSGFGGEFFGSSVARV